MCAGVCGGCIFRLSEHGCLQELSEMSHVVVGSSESLLPNVVAYIIIIHILSGNNIFLGD